MDALWSHFLSELTTAGYTTDDLSLCNHDLFLSIAEELRVFNQTEVTNLAREWHRRFDATAERSVVNGGGGSPVRASGKVLTSPTRTSASSSAGHGMSASELVDKASQIVRRAAGEGQVVISRSGVDVAPSDAGDVRPGTVHTLWKVCSPKTVAQLRRGAGLAPSDDSDDVCESGLVLYRDASPQLWRVAGSVERAAEGGWALAAFAVPIGLTRSVARREAQNLSHYRTSQCHTMMLDAGYDTLRVEDADCIVTFAPISVRYLGSVLLERAAQQPAVAAPATSFTATPVSARQDRSLTGLSTIPTSAPPALFSGTASSATKAHQKEPRDAHISGSSAAKRQPVAGPSSPSWPGPSILAEEGALSTRCTLHPQKEVEFWSPEEKRLLCSHCLYYNGYTRETCIPIEQATHLEVPPLEKWMQNVATFSKEITGVMDAFDNAEADVQRQQTRAMDVIHQEFGRLRSKLDAMEKELLAQCDASAKDAWQQLHTSAQDVSAIVQQVQRVVHDAAEPLQRFHDGFTDQAVCIRLLRCVQRAFATWAPVPVVPYMVIESVKDGVFLQSVSAAFDVVPPPTLIAGQVELPEAVDVNFLKNGCTN